MPVEKLPASAVRVQTEKAGQALVDKKLVTADQLKALFQNPVLTGAEREQATKIVENLKARIDSGELTTAAEKLVKAFGKATTTEASAADRVAAARTALETGAIDATVFERVSGAKTSLRGAIGIFLASRNADAERDALEHARLLAPKEKRDTIEKKIVAVEAQQKALRDLVDAVGNGAMERGTGVLLAGAALAGIAAMAAIETIAHGAPVVEQQMLQSVMMLSFGGPMLATAALEISKRLGHETRLRAALS